MLTSNLYSQTFPNGSGSRFVFENVEKKETGPTSTDFEYAKEINKVDTKSGVDLLKLDTQVSSQIESKERLTKFDKFSKLVHKKINQKWKHCTNSILLDCTLVD